LVYNIPNCKALFAIHDARDLEVPSTTDFVAPKRKATEKPWLKVKEETW
jgi:hypothetical protein